MKREYRFNLTTNEKKPKNANSTSNSRKTANPLELANMAINSGQVHETTGVSNDVRG